MPSNILFERGARMDLSGEDSPRIKSAHNSSFSPCCYFIPPFVFSKNTLYSRLCLRFQPSRIGRYACSYRPIRVFITADTRQDNAHSRMTCRAFKEDFNGEMGQLARFDSAFKHSVLLKAVSENRMLGNTNS